MTAGEQRDEDQQTRSAAQQAEKAAKAAQDAVPADGGAAIVDEGLDSISNLVGPFSVIASLAHLLTGKGRRPSG